MYQCSAEGGRQHLQAPYCPLSTQVDLCIIVNQGFLIEICQPSENYIHVYELNTWLGFLFYEYF